VQRCLGLILLSTVLELAESRPRFYDLAQTAGWWGAVNGFMKCGFWETLAIIGVTSLWVLPVMAARARVRIAFALGCAALHVLLCDLFYFHFMENQPNWLDHFWGTTDTRGLDGGPLGFLTWGIAQIAGSLAYDAVAAGRLGSAFAKILGWGIVLLLVGYGLSCLSMLYPATQPPSTEAEQIQVADSPVRPPTDNVPVDLHAWLAPPPFVQPAPEEQRQLNYWLMSKRVVTLPFILSATGYALAVYALFILLCDLLPLQLGIFRTFGQNPLAAYVLHGIIGEAIRVFGPSAETATPPWIAGTLLAQFGMTYLFVRYLEKNRIFLRM
jgi:hypothetical protein